MLNSADYFILVVVILSAGIGLWRGLIKELFALVNWVVALFLAYSFYGPVAESLPIGEVSGAPWLKNVAAGGLIFVVTLICGGLLSAMLQGLVRISGLGGTDKTLGMVFGVLRGASVVMALVIILPAATPISGQQWWVESHLIPYFLESEDWARGLIETVSNWFNALMLGSK